MNFSLPMGIVLGCMAIYWVIVGEVANPLIFANPSALLIVFGGTFAAALICFPISNTFNILRVLWRAARGTFYKESLSAIQEIINVAELVNNGTDLNDAVARVQNPFLRESILVASEGAISDEDLETVLIKRVEVQNEKYKQDASTFKIIGKFPPAFGLIGTSLGMIALLQSLGTEGAFQKLGPSMSVALTATFWGLVVANLFLIPISENLTIASQHDLVTRRIVVEGVLLIKEGKHPKVIEEYLKSYLSPQVRNNLERMKPV